MSTNLRNNSRVKTNIDCIFGVTPEATRSGKVTSLSVAGCFVKTTIWATDVPTIYIRLWLNSQRWLRLQGSVLYHLEKIGFGLRFADLTPQDESALIELIEQSAKPASSGVNGDEPPE
jgi:PilZ domain